MPNCGAAEVRTSEKFKVAALLPSRWIDNETSNPSLCNIDCTQPNGNSRRCLAMSLALLFVSTSPNTQKQPQKRGHEVAAPALPKSKRRVVVCIALMCRRQARL